MPTERANVIDLDRTGHALLLLPLEQVVSDLATLSLVVHGRTFGQVRADAGAAALLDSSHEHWVRRLQDQDEDLDGLDLDQVLAARAEDDDPFPNAVDFFGEDWDGWRPEPRLLTVSWLQQAAPEVLRWLANPDDGWGLDHESSLWLAPEDEPRLGSLLRQRGYEPVRVSGLAPAYDDPPRNVDGWLRVAFDAQSAVL